MRKVFRSYYPPTADEFQELWQKCHFVPDTNVLLGLYRYTSKTAQALLDRFEEVSPRIWLPHRVGFEFLRGRHAVIADQAAVYASARRSV